MSTHKWIDRICAGALALALVLTVLFMNGEALGIKVVAATLGYENRLFDNTRVHTLDIVIDDWDGFISTAQNEMYEMCSVVIDGEKYSNVAIRAKGNTSLMNVTTMGSQRYSFKIEFDHYDSTKSYHGLDKLSLNNLIQDNTMMKDYLAYTLMAEFGAPAPLCSFVFVTVNGEDFGLYLAVEAVEDSFAVRTYGSTEGDLYKPDTLNMGGDEGNGDEGAGDAGGSGGGEEATGGDNSSSGGGEATATEPTGEIPAGDEGSAGSEGGETATLPADAEATQPAGSEGGEVTGTEPTGEVPAGDEASAGSEGGETAATIPADAEATQPAGSEGGEVTGTEPTGEAPAGDEASAGSEGGETAATEPAGDAAAGEDASSGGGEDTGAENPGFDMGGMGGMFGMGGSSATLQYVDDDPDSYSSLFASAKTEVTEEDQLRMVEALKILDTGSADSVDVDLVIRYFVVHNYVVNGDSYTGSIIHNYYLYEEDGILSMIPWDYNLAYGTFTVGDASGSINDDIDRPLSTSGNDRPMLDWILNSEEYTELYHTYFQEFLDTVDPVAIVEAAYELIAPYVEKDPTKFCSYEDFETGVEAMKAFCKLRSQSVQEQLDWGTATVDASGLDLADLGAMGDSADGAGGDSSGGGETTETTNPSGGGETTQEGTENTSGGEQPADPAGTGTATPDATTPTGEAPTGDATSEGSEGGDVTATAPTGDAAATTPTGEAPAGDATSEGSEGGDVTATAPTGDAAATTPTGEAPAGDAASEGSEGGEATATTPAGEAPTGTEGENPSDTEGAAAGTQQFPSFGGQSGMTVPEGMEMPTGMEDVFSGQSGTGLAQGNDNQTLLIITAAVLALSLLAAFLFKR